jgi:hypothetical protein
MPAVTLVVCVHLQRDLLERLLRESQGCYDDLVVEHDIPDTQNVRSVVEAAGGRFFERPPSFLQEPHWPFLWAQAKHDWILQLDADEFPSEEMKKWLQEFRRTSEPPAEISGYTCIWPLWDGKRMVSQKWPAGRIFLFHKQRVRFLGMCEQEPIPDDRYEPVDLILHHEPKRKSYGLHNTVIREQSRRGGVHIAHCLIGRPTDLVCWRWTSEHWPLHWEQIRQRPVRTALKRVLKGFLFGIRDQWQTEGRLFPVAAMTGPLHQVLICLKYRRLRRDQVKNRNKP